MLKVFSAAFENVLLCMQALCASLLLVLVAWGLQACTHKAFLGCFFGGVGIVSMH